jgi:hypothetical protein
MWALIPGPHGAVAQPASDGAAEQAVTSDETVTSAEPEGAGKVAASGKVACDPNAT